MIVNAKVMAFEGTQTARAVPHTTKTMTVVTCSLHSTPTLKRCLPIISVFFRQMLDVAAVLPCALHLVCSRIAQPAGDCDSLHASCSLQAVGSVCDEGCCEEQNLQQCSTCMSC